MQFAVVPILPTYAHRFGLSGFEEGMLLAATGLATLVVSIPAGALSDRFGARAATVASGVLMCLAAVLQGLAPNFGLLLLARLVFGLGYGVVWTAGVSWLAESAPSGSSIGGSVASAGIGGMVGPAVIGLLARYFGLTIPFLAAALLFAGVTAALALPRLPAPRSAPEARLRPDFSQVAADRGTILAGAGVVIAALTSGVCSLLIPTVLHNHGGSSATIGLAFSAAGVLFVVGSLVTTWFGARAVRLAVGVLALLALVASLAPAAVSLAPVAVVVALCASSGSRAVTWTVSYPLGAAGALRSGSGVGVVIGLLNGVWAATAVATPLVAGVAAEHLSTRLVFALAEMACLVVLAGALLLTRVLRPAP